MTNALLVGLGGMLGSVLRYWLTVGAVSLFGATRLPFGTLVVNLLGCFAIGVFSQFADGRAVDSERTRVLFAVGFLGGFTTFSAFGNETVNALRAGDAGIAVVNVLAQVAGGLLCVVLGRAVTLALYR